MLKFCMKLDIITCMKPITVQWCLSDCANAQAGLHFYYSFFFFFFFFFLCACNKIRFCDKVRGKLYYMHLRSPHPVVSPGNIYLDICAVKLSIKEKQSQKQVANGMKT